MKKSKNTLIIIRGPHGSGKSTLARALFYYIPNLALLDENYFEQVFFNSNISSQQRILIGSWLNNILTSLADAQYNVVITLSWTNSEMKKFSRIIDENHKLRKFNLHYFFLNTTKEQLISRLSNIPNTEQLIDYVKNNYKNYSKLKTEIGLDNTNKTTGETIIEVLRVISSVVPNTHVRSQ